VLIGANATGKTHLLKVLYSACSITMDEPAEPPEGGFPYRLLEVFKPANRDIQRLYRNSVLFDDVDVHVHREGGDLRWSGRSLHSLRSQEPGSWRGTRMECVFVPAKEFLSHSRGFRSLYARREVSFDQTYPDLIDRALLPPLREQPEDGRVEILALLEEAMEGTVVCDDEEFYLDSRGRKLEFTLLAEGLRKLALPWLLVRNEVLHEGCILLWDEPEANLNPSAITTVLEVLLRLSRLGVQVFLATHSYVVLKLLDLRSRPDDSLAFHALYRDEQTGEIAVSSTGEYATVHPNAIADTFADLYDDEISRALRRGGT